MIHRFVRLIETNNLIPARPNLITYLNDRALKDIFIFRFYRQLQMPYLATKWAIRSGWDRYQTVSSKCLLLNVPFSRTVIIFLLQSNGCSGFESIRHRIFGLLICVIICFLTRELIKVSIRQVRLS